MGRTDTQRRQAVSVGGEEPPSTSVLSVASILKPPRITLGELAYDRLRGAILTTKLLPGTPISENELSQAVGVSRTPIREAIRRLAEERLVEVTPQSGTIVAKISPSRARQAIFVRQTIECGVLAKAAALDNARLAQLDEQVDRHLRAIDAGDAAAAAGMDEAFHELLMSVCDCPEASAATRAVSADIARILFLSGSDADYYASVATDHQRLVRLLRSGSRDEAVELLRRHIGGFAVDQEMLRVHASEYFAPEGS